MAENDNGLPPFRTWGRWLKYHRKTYMFEGLTQEQLAQRVGVTKQTISDYENDRSSSGGPRQPTRDTVDRFAAALGVPRAAARLAAGYAPENKPGADKWLALYDDDDITDEDRAELLTVVAALIRAKKEHRQARHHGAPGAPH